MGKRYRFSYYSSYFCDVLLNTGYTNYLYIESVDYQIPDGYFKVEIYRGDANSIGNPEPLSSSSTGTIDYVGDVDYYTYTPSEMPL